jgi:glycosyltransferase involved in cell wall biosynthesis
MRILLTGNSPFCNTGYGKQPAQLALQLKALGHEVAIFAYYGLGGSLFNWNGIPIYPNPAEDYGAKWAEEVYKHFQADCIITLVDVWVQGEFSTKLKWFPWTPIDHEPMPPNVYKVLSTHTGIYKPIAMSRFGEKEMKRLGIDCFYVPHMIDCTVFQPDLELRKAQREKVGWADKFVIGKVGTNVRERKDWTAAFLALSKFRRYHDDAIMYCHTDAAETRGRHLQILRENLMIQDMTFFPSRTELLLTGVSDITMNNMYNSLDIYLSNSKGEGFGIPTIEAQAAGVPVIVSNNTAQPELCGGGWILKDMKPEFDEQSSWEGAANPDEIVEYLEQAYQEKKSGKLAERKISAREKAMEYDIGNVMQNHWIPTLAEIDRLLKMALEPHYGDRQWSPQNWEAIRGRDYRQCFIPAECKPEKVIDIGCGPKSPWRKYLEPLGEYTGIDIQGGEGVTQMDAHNLRFPDKEFGFAWCCDVLEHVDNPAKVVSEARRVAKHGAIVFCTPNAKEFNVDPEHKAVELKYALTKAGHGLITW